MNEWKDGQQPGPKRGGREGERRRETSLLRAVTPGAKVKDGVERALAEGGLVLHLHTISQCHH